MIGQLVRFVVSGGDRHRARCRRLCARRDSWLAGTRSSAISSLMSSRSPPVTSCTAVELPRTMAEADPRDRKCAFAVVSLISYALNSLLGLAAVQPISAGPRGADRADAVRHPGGDFRPQPPVGVPLMERVVYQQMAELDQRHWWYRARREVLAALIRRAGRAARRARRSSKLAAAPGTISPCSAQFGTGRRARARRRGAGDRRAAARASRSMSSPLPELKGVARAPLRPHRRVRRDRAYRRRPRRAGLDRQAAEARRQARHDRSRAPMDVVGARRRQPSPAPLFEAALAAR